MAEFTKPLQELVSDARSYADGQIDSFKLQVTKGLSLSLSQILSLILVVLCVFAMLLALGAAFVLLLGQLTGSYIVGALVVAGVFAAITAVLLIVRNKLFVNSFVKLFSGLFFSAPTIPEDEE